MSTIINRFKEPSTWAGLGVLLGMFGVHIAPELWQPAIQGITGIAGAAAVLMGESK